MALSARNCARLRHYGLLVATHSSPHSHQPPRKGRHPKGTRREQEGEQERLRERQRRTLRAAGPQKLGCGDGGDKAGQKQHRDLGTEIEAN